MGGGGLALISGSLTSAGSLHVLRLVRHTHCLFLTLLGVSYHYHFCKYVHINKSIFQLGSWREWSVSNWTHSNLLQALKADQ